MFEVQNVVAEKKVKKYFNVTCFKELIEKNAPKINVGHAIMVNRKIDTVSKDKRIKKDSQMDRKTKRRVDG